MGVGLEYTPIYASEINGVSERFMKEIGVRTRFLLFSSSM